MPNTNQITQVIELGVQQITQDNVLVARAIAALAQENARARVSAGSVTNLTDSSGGTAGAGLAAVVTPIVAAQDGSTLLAPKTGFDTQMALVEGGNKELAVKANEIIALITPGASNRLVREMTAGSANDTIAAIDPALSGVTTAGAGVEDATGVAQIVHARNNQSAICAAINHVRVAQGLAPISDNSGGVFTLGVGASGYPTEDAATTGTAAGAGENSLTEVSVEAALSSLRNNIATMAAALTEANAPAIGPFVVATNNPRTRLIAGDVTG